MEIPKPLLYSILAIGFLFLANRTKKNKTSVFLAYLGALCHFVTKDTIQYSKVFLFVILTALFIPLPKKEDINIKELNEIFTFIALPFFIFCLSIPFLVIICREIPNYSFAKFYISCSWGLIPIFAFSLEKKITITQMKKDFISLSYFTVPIAFLIGFDFFLDTFHQIHRIRDVSAEEILLLSKYLLIIEDFEPNSKVLFQIDTLSSFVLCSILPSSFIFFLEKYDQNKSFPSKFFALNILTFGIAAVSFEYLTLTLILIINIIGFLIINSFFFKSGVQKKTLNTCYLFLFTLIGTLFVFHTGKTHNSVSQKLKFKNFDDERIGYTSVDRARTSRLEGYFLQYKKNQKSLFNGIGLPRNSEEKQEWYRDFRLTGHSKALDEIWMFGLPIGILIQLPFILPIIFLVYFFKYFSKSKWDWLFLWSISTSSLIASIVGQWGQLTPVIALQLSLSGLIFILGSRKKDELKKLTKGQ